MPKERIRAEHFSLDVQDLLRLLHHFSVRYVIIGGEAVIYHGYARLTGDVDFFYDCSRENSQALFSCLKEFWGGTIPGVRKSSEFEKPGVVVQFGRPPNRIDFVNRIDGVLFMDAWETRTMAEVCIRERNVPIGFLSVKNLIRNKEQVARPKDLDDLRFLRALGEKRTAGDQRTKRKRSRK